jgi:Fe-S oxidoreductase
MFAYDKEMQKRAKSYVKILKETGVDIGWFGNWDMCCGGRAKQMGFRKEFEAQAQANALVWEKAGAPKIVTPCSDCYHAIKRQYALLGINANVVHAVELIAELIDLDKLKPKNTVDIAVTYHDPCHLGRLGESFEPWNGTEEKILNQVHTWTPARPRYAGTYGIYDAPRKILESIPGVRLIEMERIRENTWCCGAGGGCNVFNPEYANAVASERITEAQETGAEAIVTACPRCKSNLSDVLSENGTSTEVIDIIDLVSKSL